MPELPEVESLRAGLEKVLKGRTVKDIEIRNGKLVSGSGTKRTASKKKSFEFVDNLKDKKILSVKRRAKNIFIELDTKEIILVHLKMTGQLVYENQKTGKVKNNIVTGGHPIEELYRQTLPHKHTHIIFTLDSGTLYYNDVRKFGYVLYYKDIDAAIEANHFSKIGLEPFDPAFTFQYFRDEIKKKNKALKTVLLEQSVVVGCGNIYADEVCFASKVLPSRNCKTLTDTEIKLIHKNIIKMLRHAIDLGGSSISDYLLADGSRGNFAREHKVYGRGGEKCEICKNILEKSVIAGRTTVFCLICQK
jgi:formamidopyrimidine-DNA glycosylase